MFHHPEEIKEPDLATQAIFAQGNLIGELAKKLFPGGIDLPTENFTVNLQTTQELLKEDKPLFEAGIIFENCYSRIDVLLPTETNEYDIVEVKSGTKVKEENLNDVSFQKYCCEKSGLKIRNCYLLHVDNTYLKQGEIDPKKILIQEDVTSQVNVLMETIQDKIDSLFEVINSSECPDLKPNPLKNATHNCKKEGCLDDLPSDNVFTLYRAGKKAFELYDKGIESISKIPSDFKLNPKQELQKNSEISNKTHIHKESIKHFLKTLTYPLYYLDFETINPVLPKYEGMKPYQRIPFQFSLHVVKEKGGEVEHYEFLHDSKEDPRGLFLAELKKVLGETGTIVTYNQAFEMGVLKECSEAFPEFKDWVENTLIRIVDLWVPFRNFSYYNPSQHGSASIKQVLPAVTGKDYSDLDIGDGGTASLKFIDITYGSVLKEEKLKIREDLLKYCCLDTKGMVDIVEKLKENVGEF
jgi:hypothetical protein|tara:strand:- start:1506 stop:2909 length:1404 start_codon:yes stop_codon:yes gene_type:complete